MVEDDSRKYAIAVKSVLANVMQDRLMREYDKLYPTYNLGKYKGYPPSKYRAMAR